MKETEKEPFKKFSEVLAVILLSSWLFWISWNHIAPTHFNFLPTQWLHLEFLQCAALMFVVRSFTVVMRER